MAASLAALLARRAAGCMRLSLILNYGEPGSKDEGDLAGTRQLAEALPRSVRARARAGVLIDPCMLGRRGAPRCPQAHADRGAPSCNACSPARSILAAVPPTLEIYMCGPHAPVDPAIEWEAARDIMITDPYCFHDGPRDGSGFPDLEAEFADEGEREDAIVERLNATQKAKIYALAESAPALPPAVLPALGALDHLLARGARGRGRAGGAQCAGSKPLACAAMHCCLLTSCAALPPRHPTVQAPRTARPPPRSTSRCTKSTLPSPLTTSWRACRPG